MTNESFANTTRFNGPAPLGQLANSRQKSQSAAESISTGLFRSRRLINIESRCYWCWPKGHGATRVVLVNDRRIRPWDAMQSIRVGCAAIAVKGGRLLLGRRGKEPFYGKWIIPGGGINLFE